MVKFFKSAWPVLVLGVLFIVNGYADVIPQAKDPANAILGDWQYMDNKTGKVSTILEVTKSDNQFNGRLVKVFHHKTNPTTHCHKCEGKRRGKPVEGLMILRGMMYKNGFYSGGYILDARSGKEYRCHIYIVNHGQEMKMRGYLGLPILGKTVYWHRYNKKQNETT